MNTPMSWLRDYVDIDVTTKEFMDALTLSGSKVEGVEQFGFDISKVVVGQILEIEKHPDADKLVVTEFNIHMMNLYRLLQAQLIFLLVQRYRLHLIVET